MFEPIGQVKRDTGSQELRFSHEPWMVRFVVPLEIDPTSTEVVEQTVQQITDRLRQELRIEADIPTCAVVELSSGAGITASAGSPVDSRNRGSDCVAGLLASTFRAPEAAFIHHASLQLNTGGADLTASSDISTGVSLGDCPGDSAKSDGLPPDDVLDLDQCQIVGTAAEASEWLKLSLENDNEHQVQEVPSTASLVSWDECAPCMKDSGEVSSTHDSVAEHDNEHRIQDVTSSSSLVSWDESAPCMKGSTGDLRSTRESGAENNNKHQVQQITSSSSSLVSWAECVPCVNGSGDVSSTHGSDGAGTKRRDKDLDEWYKKLNLLRQYKDENGHCMVPQKHKILGTWVNKQRSQYTKLVNNKKSSLTPRKVALLESIGFQWPKPRSSWDERYLELKTFFEANKHSNVPTKYGKNAKLGRWISTQRSEYPKYLKAIESGLRVEDVCQSLNAERVEMLKKVEFSWSRKTKASDAKAEATVKKAKRSPRKHARRPRRLTKAACLWTDVDDDDDDEWRPLDCWE